MQIKKYLRLKQWKLRSRRFVHRQRTDARHCTLSATAATTIMYNPLSIYDRSLCQFQTI